MKFVFFVLLFVQLVYKVKVQVYDPSQRICRKATPVDLEIKNNTFVRTGPRASKEEWYQSLDWVAVPNGEVTLTTQLWMKVRRWSNIPAESRDLFGADTNGLAKIARFALGIPRFSDIKLGKVITDPYLFKPRPCTVVYFDQNWRANVEYQIFFNVSTKHHEQVLLVGYLTFPI